MTIQQDSGSHHTFPLTSGGVLAWHEYGDPGGKPLVMLHGWPSSGLQGIFLHEYGLRHGVRVIAPSRPGIGGSTPQAERSLLDWPPLVAELADGLGIREFHLIGVSGGGPYALACAWALGCRVRHTAVVCGAPPLASAEARRRFAPVYQGLLAVNDHSPALLRAFLTVVAWFARWPLPFPLFRLATLILPKRDREVLHDRSRFPLFFPPFALAMKSGGSAVFADGRSYSRPWGFDPAEIRTPVSVWHGRHDNNFHWELARNLAESIPGASFHLAEEGHYSIPVMQLEPILAEVFGGG